ncbi:MAG TPA: mechanosensitive ion channel protein [Lachnoclostridium sp.]|nr:mechanosensitive ion channel protein [Lachnoclostridium sp.]
MFNMDIGQPVSPLNALLTSLVPLGLKILEALVIFVIGKKLINFALKLLNGAAARAGLDVGLARFLSTVARIALYILLAFVIIGELGFNTASIIAVLGSAALAVGLSLQGSLANFAGSVLILVTRPFRVGDYIICSGGEGTVKDIGLVFTELTTGDNRRITIPNGSLANGPITNITAHSTRRVDLTVGISYSADLKKAKEVITETIQKNSYILKDQPIAVFVNSLGESDVVLACGGWVNTPDYLAAKRALTEEIKLAFDEAGVEIPFPQVDVHMKQE